MHLVDEIKFQVLLELLSVLKLVELPDEKLIEPISLKNIAYFLRLYRISGAPAKANKLRFLAHISKFLSAILKFGG